MGFMESIISLFHENCISIVLILHPLAETCILLHKALSDISVKQRGRVMSGLYKIKIGARGYQGA